MLSIPSGFETALGTFLALFLLLLLGPGAISSVTLWTASGTTSEAPLEAFWTAVTHDT
ncbi:unnamed protein product, partial [Dicrocoelium dendriticum]